MLACKQFCNSGTGRQFSISHFQYHRFTDQNPINNPEKIACPDLRDAPKESFMVFIEQRGWANKKIGRLDADLIDGDTAGFAIDGVLNPAYLNPQIRTARVQKHGADTYE